MSSFGGQNRKIIGLTFSFVQKSITIHQIRQSLRSPSSENRDPSNNSGFRVLNLFGGGGAVHTKAGATLLGYTLGARY